MLRSFAGNAPTNRYISLWFSAIILYAFYIWGHIPVSNICYALSDQYTPSVYRDYVILAGKVLLVFFIAGTVYLIAKSRQKLLNTLLWAIFSITLFFSYESMVKISIEYIHFIQYCGLTIVFCHIFPKRLSVAVFLALFAGFMDEVYQAYPEGPMNWRDTLLNVTGVTWGCLLYWTQQDALSPNFFSTHRF